jgi:hypothetical protein
MSAPTIDRDLEILRSVQDMRVASTRQIERLHFPALDGGTAVSSARRCRRVLERLTDQRSLERLERRIGGVRAGSASWLYRLGRSGYRQLGITGRPAWREPSRWFVDHLLAIGDVRVGLIDAERRHLIESVTVAHEPESWRRFLAPHGGTETLKPDLQVDIVTKGDELRWWVEVDRATEGLPTVVRKAQVYERYWRCGQEEQRSDIFPQVVWLVPHERRAEAIRRAIEERRDLSPELQVVALQAEAIAIMIDSNINEPEGGATP